MAIKNKKLLLGSVLFLIIADLFLYRVTIKNWILYLTQSKLPVAIDYTEPFNKKIAEVNYAIPVPEKNQAVQPPLTRDNTIKIPAPEKNNPTLKVKSYNLNIPFTMQAPYSDWSEPWQNTCEEAAILMVHYYYQGKNFTKETAKIELEKLINWQNENFGNYLDTNIQQTAEMVTKNWGYETQIINNPTVEEIKKFIAEGLPVIMPTAGRELNNPYFVQPGPIYHMIVIKGYTDDGKFITNDPGIGKGHDYLYNYNILMNALHDWTDNEETILQGSKKILVILP